MRLRHAWALALVLVPISVWANDHSADMNSAFSYNEGSKLWGPYFSLGITPVRRDGTWERVSLVGDLGLHLGENNAGADVTRVAFAGGLRFWATPDPWRNRLFGQVVVGGVRNHVGADSNTTRALMVGVGYEFHHRASSLNSGLATRVQVDYLAVNDVKNSARVSVGIVYRVQ